MLSVAAVIGFRPQLLQCIHFTIILLLLMFLFFSGKLIGLVFSGLWHYFVSLGSALSKYISWQFSFGKIVKAEAKF